MAEEHFTRGLLGKMIEERQRQYWARPQSWWNLLVLVPLLLILLYLVHSCRENLEIAKRQRTAVAIISSHDPANHDRYGYIFSVNSRPFSGWAYPNDKRDFSVGEQIVVFYDPIDPSKNLPSSFGLFDAGDDVLFAFFLVAPIIVAVSIHAQRREWKRRHTGGLKL